MHLPKLWQGLSWINKNAAFMVTRQVQSMNHRKKQNQTLKQRGGKVRVKYGDTRTTLDGSTG